MHALGHVARLWALGAAVVAAFDIDAHDAIGQTTASAMDQQATKQVKRLLDGKDASDVAGWGHQVDDTFPGMERLHFQIHDDTAGQPFCGPAESRVVKCEDNICLMSAIKHFYGKVLEKERRKFDYPAIDYNKAAQGVKFSDADSVKMLINLLGDLHQPMHLGFAGSDTGRAVKLKFRGKEMTLYDFWDKTISETVRDQESNFWLSGWTHVRAVQEDFAKDKELFKSQGAFKAFETWAQETADLACSEAYVLQGKKLAGPDAGSQSSPVEVTESDYQRWRKVWMRQILLAGERTAIVLNDILDDSKASKLHEGAGVKTNADKKQEEVMKQWQKEREAERKKEPRRTSATGPRIHVGNATTNLGIAAVVVTLFLFVVNHGPNPARWGEMIMSMLEGSSSGNSGGPGGGGPGKRWE